MASAGWRHEILVVGPLQNCVSIAKLLPIQDSEEINIACRQPTKSPSIQTLKSIAAQVVVLNWTSLFPKGSKGRKAMKSIPHALWEEILKYFPLSSSDELNLVDVVKRVKVLTDMSEPLPVANLPSVLFYRDEMTSSRNKIDPKNFVSALHSESYLVWWKVGKGMARDDDSVMVAKGGEEPLFKNLTGLVADFPYAKAYWFTESRLLDTYLPSELLEFRKLFSVPKNPSPWQQQKENVPVLAWYTLKGKSESSKVALKNVNNLEMVL